MLLAENLRETDPVVRDLERLRHRDSVPTRQPGREGLAVATLDGLLNREPAPVHGGPEPGIEVGDAFAAAGGARGAPHGRERLDHDGRRRRRLGDLDRFGLDRRRLRHRLLGELGLDRVLERQLALDHAARHLVG